VGYNTSKDCVLKEWKLGSFFISVRSYEKGELKLQIGPRFMGGVDSNFTRLGRLSLTEAEALSSCLGETIDLMKTKMKESENEKEQE